MRWCCTAFAPGCGSCWRVPTRDGNDATHTHRERESLTMLCCRRNNCQPAELDNQHTWCTYINVPTQGWYANRSVGQGSEPWFHDERCKRRCRLLDAHEPAGYTGNCAGAPRMAVGATTPCFARHGRVEFFHLAAPAHSVTLGQGMEHGASVVASVFVKCA